jgi:capsular polysaccharide transport system ATP-binding protein
MIIVDDVHKHYMTGHGYGKWILQGVSFTIPPKVNVGLVGGNGAGKSTLLRLIGGIDMPTKGRIERNCRVSWPMGFGGGLQGSLTGRQNAKFVCRIHGHEDDIPDRIAFIQDFAELGEFFDEPVNTYSSGMKARLQFGLSLAFDFDVYISDEVTSTGDAAFRKKAAAAFNKLTDHAGLIMVSHGEGTLKQFCSAGIWLNEGKAHWFDDINEALKAYRSSLSAKTIVDGSVRLTKNKKMKVRALARSKRRQDALDILKKGLEGEPVTVSYDEGVRIVRFAKGQGMDLIVMGHIAKRGYQLKPEAIPVLRRWRPAPCENEIADIYDLSRQCIKVIPSK